ncbi:hypothetical protein [Phocaeicola dorei]|uniref:hypothetical protein n=1 Tax=Phocaeicola dorei TaxID=357276 RepID=UPI000A98558B|nr:hypothetical protein [Phocaeicola dorei]
MNKRHYEHTLPNIRGSLSNTYGGSNEAFEIMFFVKPGMDEYFELTDEGYKWVS